MPARETYATARVVEEARRLVESVGLVRIRTTIFVHERGDGSAACPCCGSRSASISETIPDLDLLIDADTGDRVLRSEATDLKAFDELAATARDIPITIRVSRPQLAILLAEAPLIFVSGGSRVGKSAIAAWWFVRRMLLRGGRGRIFWILGPSVRACFISLGKILLGREGEPPALPLDDLGRPLLAVRWPDSDKAHDLRTVLLDGTILDLRPLSRKGAEQIRGESLVDALLEEATAIKRLEHYVEAQARVASANGTLFASTTPDPPHFLEDTIVAAEKEQAAAEEEGRTPRVIHASLTRWDNPWLDPARIAEDEVRLRETAGEAAVSRQIYGRWVVADGARFWRHWDERYVLPPREDSSISRCVTVDGRTMIDVTERAAARFVNWSDAGWFVRGLRASNLRWICGLDVNRRPISLMALKIWSTEETMNDPGAWGVAVVGEVGRASVESVAAFADFASIAAGGRFAGTLVYADPQHCHRERDLKTSSTPMAGNESAREMALAGFDCRPAATRATGGVTIGTTRGHVPCSPSRGDSHELLQRLMYEGRFYVSPQCPRLLEALDKQQPRPGFNEPIKVANAASDRLSNALDGVRYAVWRLFGAADGPTLRR